MRSNDTIDVKTFQKKILKNVKKNVKNVTKLTGNLN